MSATDRYLAALNEFYINMNTCNTCQHWHNLNSLTGVCTLITVSGSGTHLATIGKGGDHDAIMLITDASFGCAAHQAVAA